MRLAPVLAFASIFAMASCKGPDISSHVTFDYTVEFLDAANVVSTLNACVDYLVTATRDKAGGVDFTVKPMPPQGKLTLAGTAGKPLDVPRSPHGALRLDHVAAGGNTASGTFTLGANPITHRVQRATPKVTVDVKLLFDIVVGSTSSSGTPFTMTKITLTPLTYTGKGGKGELDWRITNLKSRYWNQ